jgi:hypothetical protein
MESDWIEFVETGVFTKRVQQNRLEETLRALQLELVENPTAGDVDAGTGGLRKVRMPDPLRGKGKRGGVRVHYLWVPSRKRVYLLYLYTKDEQDSLSNDQKKALKKVVDQITGELQ